ncbi:hypothetical protein Tco_0191181 [Tanacetum coccineum]
MRITKMKMMLLFMLSLCLVNHIYASTSGAVEKASRESYTGFESSLRGSGGRSFGSRSSSFGSRSSSFGSSRGSSSGSSQTRGIGASRGGSISSGSHGISGGSSNTHHNGCLHKAAFHPLASIILGVLVLIM